MHITLQKRDKGQTWASPILGQGQLDPYVTDLEQKRLMLQRFQEEVNFTFNTIPFANNGSKLQKSFGLLSIISLSRTFSLVVVVCKLQMCHSFSTCHLLLFLFTTSFFYCFCVFKEMFIPSHRHRE